MLVYIYGNGNETLLEPAQISKNAVFWDAVPCKSCVNRRFGGTYRIHLRGKKIQREQMAAVSSHLLTVVPCSRIFLPEDGGDMFLRNVG
jgi:hypothetical protein